MRGKLVLAHRLIARAAPRLVARAARAPRRRARGGLGRAPDPRSRSRRRSARRRSSTSRATSSGAPATSGERRCRRSGARRRGRRPRARRRRRRPTGQAGDPHLAQPAAGGGEQARPSVVARGRGSSTSSSSDRDCAASGAPTQIVSSLLPSSSASSTTCWSPARRTSATWTGDEVSDMANCSFQTGARRSRSEWRALCSRALTAPGGTLRWAAASAWVEAGEVEELDRGALAGGSVAIARGSRAAAASASSAASRSTAVRGGRVAEVDGRAGARAQRVTAVVEPDAGEPGAETVAVAQPLEREQRGQDRVLRGVGGGVDRRAPVGRRAAARARAARRARRTRPGRRHGRGGRDRRRLGTAGMVPRRALRVTRGARTSTPALREGIGRRGGPDNVGSRAGIGGNPTFSAARGPGCPGFATV